MQLLIQIILVLIAGGLTLLLFRFRDRWAYKSVSGTQEVSKEKKDFLIKIVVIIVVCVATFFLTNNPIKTIAKNMYISNFEQFVVKVEENHKDYSKEDWIKIEEEYEQLSVKNRLIHEKLFTQEDKNRISSLEGEYSSYQSIGFFNNVFETIKDAFDNTVEYVDGFNKGLNNTIESDTANE